MAVAAGADALGLVSHMPSGPGVIDDTLIAHIAAQCGPDVSNHRPAGSHFFAHCPPDRAVHRLAASAVPNHPHPAGG